MTIVAVGSALAVLIANASGIATGDDGVGYRAIADSLLAGDGLGYFLEDPVTVWPPLWPGLMALVAAVTPLGTMGAAVVLNAAVAAVAVLVGHRLLKELVTDDRLVVLGTLVVAFGPTAIGFGRLLMTDMAFAVVTMIWVLAMSRARDSDRIWDLASAAMLAWVAFGLRYVGLVLVGFGPLWLLLDNRRDVAERVRRAALHGVTAGAVPLAWMLRNYSIDGTFTGERHASARGFLENAFDIAATLGRFLLPGPGYTLTRPWAVAGLVALALAGWCVFRLVSRHGLGDARQRALGFLGRPEGLLAIVAVLYLVYMLYVRTTTALNQLDVRLLFPSYFPLLVLALVLVDRMVRSEDPLAGKAVGAAHGWAVLNVAAGLVAMVAFALGHPYFAGNYESDVFDRVRANPALEAVPEGCDVYSNLPNALYPTLESRWSPMERALESVDEPDPGFGLEDIAARALERPACLVWIDRPPKYGHLWKLHELEGPLGLELLDSHEDVEVFRIAPPT